MFALIRKLHFSSTSTVQADFKTMLSKYKDSIKQISNSGNGAAALDNIHVKIANWKKPATLNDVGTLNVIDPSKAELTTFDPQVINLSSMYFLLILNLVDEICCI